MADECSHKFCDTGYCVKCGATLEAIKAAGYDEAMQLLAQLRQELDESKVQQQALREELDKYSRCWHCHDALLEDDPHHCESCPPWCGCDEPGCTAPGCVGQ